jgi:phage repressor protein C with HTH and peptisase S24 domain
MSSLADRLRRAMAHAEINQAELARRCHVKQPSVYGWLSGKSKFLRGENLLAAAGALGVSQQWLATGHGNMVPSQASQPIASRETLPNHHRFPLLEGFAGMGRGDYVGDYPEVVQFVEVTQEWATQALRGVPPDAVRVITGRGPSMRGTFNDGDLVFLDSRVKEFAGDAAYCFRWNGLVYIKRLQQIDKTHLRILSANADYPPHDVLLSELEIGGRALAAWTLRPL